MLNDLPVKEIAKEYAETDAILSTLAQKHATTTTVIVRILYDQLGYEGYRKAVKSKLSTKANKTWQKRRVKPA